MATGVAERIIDEFEAVGSRFYEVVDGRLTEGKTLGAREIWLASLIDDILDEHAKRSDLGRVVVEMIFLIDDASNLQRRPDVAFVSFDRWPPEVDIPFRSAWNVVPDLAVEVVSDSNTASEVQAKIEEYFRCGVRLVWVVYPHQQAIQSWTSPAACTVARPGETVGGAGVLPGLQLQVDMVFRPSNR